MSSALPKLSAKLLRTNMDKKLESVSAARDSRATVTRVNQSDHATITTAIQKQHANQMALLTLLASLVSATTVSPVMVSISVVPLTNVQNAMPTPSARFNLDTVVLPSRNASVQLHTLVTDTHARSVPSARTTVQAEQPVGTENVFVHLSASTTIGAKSNAWTKTNANQAKITAPRMPTARTLTMVSLAHVKMDTLEMVSLAALLTVNTLTIV